MGDKIHSMAVISDTMAIFFIVIVFAIKISYYKNKIQEDDIIKVNNCQLKI